MDEEKPNDSNVSFSCLLGGVTALRVLVACEYSGRVRDAFAKLGHDATSCDLLPTESKGKHYTGNVFDIINGLPICEKCGKMCIVDHNSFRCDNCKRLWPKEYDHETAKFDLMIAHPPCTRLTVTGNKWYKPEYRERFPNIEREREEAVEFFMKLANASIPMIAIENPVGIMSSRWRKPNQIIQPWQYGDKALKKTCLWLKGLPPLLETEIVEPHYKTYNSKTKKSGKSRYPIAWSKKSDWKERSRTFQGIANAMAEQWGGKVTST